MSLNCLRAIEVFCCGNSVDAIDLNLAIRDCPPEISSDFILCRPATSTNQVHFATFQQSGSLVYIKPMNLKDF